MKYIHEVKLGGPIKCPRCGATNPSGFYDVDRCVNCGKYRLKNYIEKLKETPPEDE